ncbi:serine/threonine protein kinase [Singulisphaera sp. GP187]|uniref:bifunctional serine/threonine-protein kinase/formylglycine-generating enzyme family protein n=1 Tax=Singulisphaera sp. GP187 TaxID=1882752 RepID=UPI000927F423|nr:bifunctional serine/threonine-protein kinase/formylglycine-generating enzyme family protein [Singulisphaera sp. GP187]SIO05792.1 serine/threonine protein kinase [Singulisphaera sp. GP187]
MTQGPSHPDEKPDDESQGSSSTQAGPFGTWAEGAGTVPTSPPRASFMPIEGTIPAFGSLSGAESQPFPSSGMESSDESIGVQGTLQPGQVLFGRYLAEKLLGEGGMGTVWLVKHLELDTLRALKLIVSGIAFDPQAQARFKREARVMARLSHPHAVVVHDARMARDAAFIEMEYIRGQSLNKAMTPGVPMPLDWIARILEQLCDVLEEAHHQKIVHRDLKPANLMLLEGRPVGREQLKVLDFGIAKILEAESDTADVHTHTGSFLGSAPYTSPEQASGGAIDGRSDIYSVGVILYEMMTGHRPFTGPITRLVYDHLYTLPPPFVERNPDCHVPAEVEAVVARCLAKNPDERPQTALELFEQFRAALPAGYLDEGPHALLQTERDPTHPLPTKRTPATPRKGLVDPSGDVRTQALTEDADRVPYQYPNLPSPPTQGYGIPKATKPSAGLDSTDWGHPALVVEAPPSGRAQRRRLLPMSLIVVVLASLGLAAFVFFPRRGVPGLAPGLPKGYVAAEGARIVNGHPSLIVRQSDKTKFILLEGGEFKMGNDGFDSSAGPNDEDQPAHRVVLSDYYLQETEVTNGELEAYFIANHVKEADRPKRWTRACQRIDRSGNYPTLYPATGVTRELAEKYARWVGGRLPTEAEWEYAARSRGKPNPYVWGTEPKPSLSMANVDSIGQLGPIPTSMVGAYQKDRTEQGIVDLTGNVREWCRDVWAPYASSTDPIKNPVVTTVPNTGSLQYVIRGGSFAVWSDRTRTTRPRRPETDDQTTSELAEDQTAEDLGFRVVIEWPKP